MDWNTAASVAGTMMAIIVAVGGYVARWARGVREENAHSQEQVSGKIDALVHSLRSVVAHFEDDGPLGREVGTLPTRMRVAEERISHLEERVHE